MYPTSAQWGSRRRGGVRQGREPLEVEVDRRHRGDDEHEAQDDGDQADA